jgi:hypothetical protein
MDSMSILEYVAQPIGGFCDATENFIMAGKSIADKSIFRWTAPIRQQDFTTVKRLQTIKPPSPRRSQPSIHRKSVREKSPKVCVFE